MFEADFLAGSPESCRAYQETIHHAAAALIHAFAGQTGSGRRVAERTSWSSDEICPPEGKPLDTVLEQVESLIHSAAGASAGRMHGALLLPALAAEVVISGWHAAQRTLDASPAAAMLEQAMVAWLCREAGLPAAAAGVFTAGGAHSQILGLRLARDACLHSRRQWSAAKWGLPPEARELRILCAETAQLTVEEAAAELGLGADAVVRVAVDEELDLCPDALTATLQRLEAQELRPMALMASAGAAGSGAIDPLAEIAAIARRWGAWLHVDAGCGGALLLSDRHRSGLRGIEAADSLGLDFCELLWQPVPCSVLLVRDAASLDLLDPHAEEDRGGRPEAGVPGPARRPVHGSPRLDALKLWVSLQVLGRNRLVAMLDHLLGLSREAARLIEGEPRLELLHRRVTGSVLFRYRPADPAAADAVNAAIPRHLLASGAAAVGSARAGGQCGLRLMLLHPCAGLDDLQELFARVTACGRRLERGAGLGS